MKPTRLRIASGRRSQGVSIRVAMLSENSVTLSVRDSAALLDATAGPVPGDPFIAPRAPRPYLEECGVDPGRLRIVLSRETPTGTSLHPECITAVEQVGKLCESLGHQVEEGVPRFDLEELSTPFAAIASAGLAWDIRNLARRTGKEPRPEHFEVGTWAMIERGRTEVTTAEALMDALAAFQEIADRIAAFLTPYDIWLTPTVGTPPPALGSFTATPDDPTRGLRKSAEFLPFTSFINVSGQPAMSVPLHWSDDGVPIGVHFVGPYGDEGMMFRLAAQLEQAQPWADRIPPVSALQA